MISRDELVQLGKDLFGRKPIVTDFARELKEAEERKTLMLKQLQTAKLKYAKQTKFEFTIPSEDWGSL